MIFKYYVSKQKQMSLSLLLVKLLETNGEFVFIVEQAPVIKGEGDVVDS